jgi:hypothetical protein
MVTFRYQVVLTGVENIFPNSLADGELPHCYGKLRGLCCYFVMPSLLKPLLKRPLKRPLERLLIRLLIRD